jgi:hypothetical protein
MRPISGGERKVEQGDIVTVVQPGIWFSGIVENIVQYKECTKVFLKTGKDRIGLERHEVLYYNNDEFLYLNKPAKIFVRG